MAVHRGRDGGVPYRSVDPVPNSSYDRLRDLAAAIELRHKANGAGTQIVGKKKLISARDASFGSRKRLQVFQIRERVSIDLQLREVDDLTPPPAGAEF